MLPPPRRGRWTIESVASRMRWIPIPPGRRRSAGTDRSGSGNGRRVEGRGRVRQHDDDVVVDQARVDLDRAASPLVAVEDDVGRRLVDGLDEVVDVHGRAGGMRARDERPGALAVGTSAAGCRTTARARSPHRR